jgi:hypothetical protein
MEKNENHEELFHEEARLNRGVSLLQKRRWTYSGWREERMKSRSTVTLGP